jgi:cell division protein ZipA
VEQLRTILIVLGLLLVVGIWLADRLRRRRASRPPQHWNEIESFNEEAIADEEMRDAGPHPDEWVGRAFTARRNEVIDEAQLEELKGLGGDADTPLADTPPLSTVSDDAAAEPAAPAPRPQPAEEVIVLTILAAKGRRLRGPLLLKALQEAGLAHGEMEIFHYHVEGHGEPLFSVANVLEPGRFVLSEMAQLETPGVALFMRLPTVMPGAEALQLLLGKARQIAARLSATLCDGQRQPLDEAALQALEKRAAAFTKQS